MDNRSIAAFIETKRTKMNSVIICLPSKGAGQEKRTSTTYITSPAIQQAIDTNHFRKRKPLLLRWYTSRPCKHGTTKLSYQATKT